MRILLIFLSLFISSLVNAQNEYFTDSVKKEGIIYFKKHVYDSCLDPKDKQDPVSAHEMKTLSQKTSEIVLKNFSKAFSENPKIKEAYLKDLKSLELSKNCQFEGNDCRANIFALSMYYIQQFRADIYGCSAGVKDERCEIEKKFRKSNLQGARFNYGQLGAGLYKKELIDVKNDVALDVFNTVMQKNKEILHICNPVARGVGHRFKLEFVHEGEFYSDLDPQYNFNEEAIAGCKDEPKVLLTEFFPTSFDDRTTAGADLVGPVKKRIQSFLNSSNEIIVTDVIVTTNSSKTPYYTTVGGKKIIDPKSDEKNLALATEKGVFVEKALKEIKSTSSQFTHINFISSAKLAGPDFDQFDLNDRFVTKMTPGYEERVRAIYNKYKDQFENDAVIKSEYDLLKEERFGNLYLAKYKPFQGFNILIKGHIKSEMKCTAQEEKKSSSKSKATKQ